MTSERNNAQLATMESEVGHRSALEMEAAVGRILISPMGAIDGRGSLKSEIAKVINLDRVLISSINLENETWTGDFSEFLNQSEF